MVVDMIQQVSKPIETYVEFFDLQSIEESVRFELSRAGQVYFLHNNIASLNKFKRQLSSMIKGVAVEVIHAKMSVEKIKSTLRGFPLCVFIQRFLKRKSEVK